MIAYTYEADSVDNRLAIGFIEAGEDPDKYWVDAKRAEWADKYAPGPVTAKAWMEAGYGHSCCYCEHMLDADTGYCDECSDAHLTDDEQPVSDIVFSARGDVYCGEHCKLAQEAEWDLHRASKAKCRAAFLARYPFAFVTHEWIGGPGGCKCFNKNHNNAALHFTFAGAKMGEHANSFCGGCRQAWVCSGDLEAFRAAKVIQ